jgi:hypothetical protein
MSFEFSDLAAQLKSGQPMEARDTLALRQWAWADGVISRSEAEGLFQLNALGKSPAREWVDFFVEAVVEFIVHQEEPKGYVSDENAAWLMAQLDADGKVESLGELELLVEVLEKSFNAPDALKAYALKQIEQIVLTGEGPTRVGGDIHAGRIDEAEVTLIRRVIFASGGSGPACVSADEAEMLFRIKDATLGADNATGWQKLFVQGVGNHLMAHSSYHPFTRDEAIKHEAFMNDTHVSIGGFLARLGQKMDFSGAGKVLFDNDDLDEVAAREAIEAADAEVSPVENAWLKAHIDADKANDPLEAALLTFLKAE